jgi:hypothetical protein
MDMIIGRPEFELQQQPQNKNSVNKKSIVAVVAIRSVVGAILSVIIVVPTINTTPASIITVTGSTND